MILQMNVWERKQESKNIFMKCYKHLIDYEMNMQKIIW